MTDFADGSLIETAQAIATGALKARDLAEQLIERIEKVDPVLAAFTAFDPAAYRAAADAADRRLADGARPGPLHGVPVAHKDMYYRKGRVSACGSKLRAGVSRDETATVLERLDAAGAIEIGQLVMVEFAMGPHGYNANYPVCRNPWDLDRIPCGSSSGSGVAVGARLVHASLGSDTGGSIRGPAAVSGVVGLVPSHGRVSRHGMMPMSFSLDVAGPLTRTVADAARILDIIAGCDPRDASSLDFPSGGYEACLSEAGPKPRIGLARGYFDENIDPEVRAKVEEAADVFIAEGHEVREVVLPADILHEVGELHPLVMKAEGAANHIAEMREQEERYTFEVSQRLHAGHFISAVDYIQALKLRGAYARSFISQAFADVDVLLTPLMGITTPTIAGTSGKTGKAYLEMVMALTRLTKVVNYLGLSALSVPCGFDRNHMPVAFQLIAKPYDEATLLRAGHAFQCNTDHHLRRPPVLQA